MNEASKHQAVSVVIPTYRRPKVLVECVRSLMQGGLLPGEIIVAGRQGDTETEQIIPSLASSTKPRVHLRSAWVTIPGHVPPVEAGVRAASGEIVAIVDDDVTVGTDWLEKILPHFSEPSVGVVGGRVVVPGAPLPRLKGKPGHVTWYGKIWGNVASMDGQAPLGVDTVMECNWAWRRELLLSLRFDPILNFDDASMYGLDLTLQAKKKGYRVVYDPAILVHHHIAPRTPELDRSDRSRRLFSYCRNHTYIMLTELPWLRKFVFVGWWFLVGERGAWGLGALAADSLLHGWRTPRHVASAFSGKAEGVREWLKSR
jgi:GT2 family glycosyltransferase